MKKAILSLSIISITAIYFSMLNLVVAEDLTRTHYGGNTEITVTLISPENLTYVEVDQLIFKVYLDTHSVNLLTYQMDKVSFLRDEEGNEYKAESWEPLDESSHHRSGVLKFFNLNDDGDFIISKSSKSIKLVIKDLAGIEERVFGWDIPE